MKQINFEELLSKHKEFQKSTVMMEDEYILKRVSLDAMKEVWNLAIQKASEEAKCESDGDYLIPEINKNSILKLKV